MLKIDRSDPEVRKQVFERIDALFTLLGVGPTDFGPATETSPEQFVENLSKLAEIVGMKLVPEDAVVVSPAFLRRAQKWNQTDAAQGAGMDLGDYIQDAYLAALHAGRHEEAEKLNRLMVWEEADTVNHGVRFYTLENIWIRFSKDKSRSGISLDEALSFIEES